MYLLYLTDFAFNTWLRGLGLGGQSGDMWSPLLTQRLPLKSGNFFKGLRTEEAWKGRRARKFQVCDENKSRQVLT